VIQRNGWIFNRRWDLLLFGGSVLFALLLAPLGQLAGLDGDRPLGFPVRYHGVLLTLKIGMVVDFFYHVLIDGPHALATAYRVYGDPAERRRRPLFYWSSPILLLAVLVLSANFFRGELLRAVSYFNIFHYIRQQYGWIRISARKGDPGSSRKLDSLAIYAATLCPLLWWHGHQTGDGWLYDGDLIMFLPARIADFFGWVQIPILGVYGFFEWKRWRSGEGFNAAKNFLLAITVFTWSGGIMFGWAGEQTFMLDIMHAVPYLGLVFFYGLRTYQGDGSWRARIFSRRGWWLYYFPLVAVAFLQFDLGFQSRGLASWWGSVCLGIMLLSPVMHYIFDGLVWKIGPANPGFQDLLHANRDFEVRTV
jgi:hypothetical protein